MELFSNHFKTHPRERTTEDLVRLHDAEAQCWKYLHPLMIAAADYREEESLGYIGATFVTREKEIYL